MVITKNRITIVVSCTVLFVMFLIIYPLEIDPWIVKQKIGSGMTKVEVYRGAWHDPSIKPILSLNAESDVAKKIIRTIKECRQRAVFTMLGVKYVIKISYLDGTCDLIAVGNNVFSFRSGRSQVSSGWTGGELFSLIGEATEKAAEESARGSQGP